MQKTKKKPGPKFLSPYSSDMEIFIQETYSQLSELEKRTYATVEALKLPRGGISYISKLLGCSRNTINRGIKALKKQAKKPVNRIRAEGGGRKSAIKTIKNIDEVFLKVIDDHIAGDPMDAEIRWTNLSHKKIASKMKVEGINISVNVVKKLLKNMDSQSVSHLKVCLFGPLKIAMSSLKKLRN
jgi:hypothetical protein